MSIQEQGARFDVGGVFIDADVSVPLDATGIVLFVHGSGSGRHSPRNQFVAESLRQHGLGTVLMDLLTPAEERADRFSGHLRFDISFLARRVSIVIGDVRAHWPLPLGLFGASTGAAAALAVAARPPGKISAVVSRGGRPDLAGDALIMVRTPTLLIVGGDDREVIALNRQAMSLMKGEVRLEIVPGASHLFQEPGALESVAQLAAAWFATHLVDGQ